MEALTECRGIGKTITLLEVLALYKTLHSSPPNRWPKPIRSGRFPHRLDPKRSSDKVYRILPKCGDSPRAKSTEGDTDARLICGFRLLPPKVATSLLTFLR
jgi:hypothetical protein